MLPALPLKLRKKTFNQESMGWISGLQMPQAKIKTNTTWEDLLYWSSQDIIVHLEGRGSCLQAWEGQSPGCHMPLSHEVVAFQILHRLFRALGQEDIHILVHFLRDNVLPFILWQAFYLQLTSFIYLIFTCYVSDLIVRNGISTLGVLWIWSSWRGEMEQLLCTLTSFQLPDRLWLQSSKMARLGEQLYKCCS